MQSRRYRLRRQARHLVVSALLIGTVIAILGIASRHNTRVCASSDPRMAWVNGCE